MTPSEAALIGAAAFLAGAMNALAGGGTFFSFPALLAVGVPPVVANASNAVALWPASIASALASRAELRRFRDKLALLSAVALAGGLMGGLLLLSIEDRAFTRLIPWLLGAATLMFALSGVLSRLLARLRRGADAAHGTAGAFFQFCVSVYGGFFGAGMGIVMIAALAIQGHTDLKEINALKNWLSAVIYSVAVATFVIAGAISWPHTLVMLVTAIAGGYAGARMARHLPARVLRGLVIAIGTGLTLHYAARG